MKKLVKVKMIILLSFVIQLMAAQAPPLIQAPFSMDGIFDTVYDHLGNKYALRDLQLDSPHPFRSVNNQQVQGGGPGKGLGNVQVVNAVPSQSCMAGKFRLFFASGGFFDNSPARQSVVCMVFNDLSNFINSPLTTKINIYCDKTPVGGPPQVLGTGAAINLFPFGPNQANPGIIQNIIQQALISGQDPLNTVPATIFPAANNFYHGYLNMNPNPPSPFYINTTGIPAAAANEQDLYTIILHEALHILGFYSLISSTGVSQFGANNNYYSVYDKYLCNAAGVPLLNSLTAGSGCPNTNQAFQGALSAIQPGGTCFNDFTNCTAAARYISPNVNVKVYTPNCWQQGSSLSHFEDMCSVPVGYAPPCGGPNNNTYYVMSNANSTGPCFQKRHPTREERYVLCDLGYNVNGVYTSPAAGAAFNYGTAACPGSNVWGINDGLLPGNVFQYITTGTSISLSKVILAGNDAPNSVVTCAQIVYGAGASLVSFVNNNVSNFSGQIFGVSAPAGTGLVVVKYIPLRANKPGNATYVFLFFSPSNCTPVNPCNMVQNNGFETTMNIPNSTCSGPIEYTWINSGPRLSCWRAYDSWPDLLTRNCPTHQMPPGYGAYNLGVSTYGIFPPLNSFAPAVGSTPNNRVIVMGAQPGAGANGGMWTQAIKNALGAPFIPGQTYQISFWVWNRSGPTNIGGSPGGWNMNNPPSPAIVSIASAANFAVMGTNYPAGLNVVTEFTVPATPTWTYVTKTVLFTSPGNISHNTLLMGIDGAKTAGLGLLLPPPNGGVVCLFDEVSVEPVPLNPVTFNIPINTICAGSSILNLAQYATAIPGVFAGTGVTLNGGVYNFNLAQNLPVGNYPVSFTYTLANGCPKTIWQNIVITNQSFSSLSVSGATTLCNNALTSVNLSANAVPGANVTYNWIPGGTGQNITVNPSSTTNYQVIASAPGLCPISGNVVVSVIPPPIITIVPTSTVLCSGLPNTLTAIGAVTYTWLPTTVSGNGNNILYPSVPGTYTVLGTAATGCTNSAMLTVVNGPTVMPIVSDVTLCTNAATSTMVIATSTFVAGPVTYMWLQPNGPNSPGQAINVSAAGVYTVTTTSPAGCPGSATMAVSIVTNCCAQPTTGLTPLTGALSGLYSNTSYFLGSNITVSGASFQNSEVWIMPGVQIDVLPGAVLDLENTHLFACGLMMWQGIVVQDGGQITTSNTRFSNSLIEDAEVGIDLSGISLTNSSPNPPIDIQRIIFNKNFIGIKISNSDPNLTSLPLGINGCVFSSRDMTFTTYPSLSLSWPSSDMLGVNDLRFAAAGATTGLVPPYQNPSNFLLSTLKSPHNAQFAHIGIKIENIGDPLGFTTNAGVEFGITYPSGVKNDFNLFEGIDIGIDVMEASLTTKNNVFQSLLNTTGQDGIGIKHNINSIKNARLDLISLISNDDGNRFWDCITGVKANNVYELFIRNALFRSTHVVPNALLPGPAEGDFGVEYETNRFNSTIVESEFENLKNGIVFRTPPGANLYDMTGTGAVPGVYGAYLDIERNYFGPEVTSTTPYIPNTSEYMGDAIRFETAPFPPGGWVGAGNAFVISNKIDRTFRGIYVNSMDAQPLAIGGNSVYIEDDATFFAPQYGIQIIDNLDNLSITENTLSANGTTNPNVTLVHCRNTNGTIGGGNFISNGNGSPFISCNYVSDSYYGFNFEGSNLATTWQANTMFNNWAGLVLSNNGVIGTQGTPLLGSANVWAGFGTWTNPPFQTLCIFSNPALSPLWVVNTWANNPTINASIGGPAYTPAELPLAAANIINDCGNNSFLPVPLLRTISSIPNISKIDNVEKIKVFPNPSSGKFTILDSQPGEHINVKVFDVTGKLVFAKEIQASDNGDIINLEVSKGIYLLEITNDSHEVSRKKLIID